MGFLKKLFSAISGNPALPESLERFEKEGKPALIRQLVYLRLAREQGIPGALQFADMGLAADFTEARGKQIKNVLDDMSDAELLGTPEATIVVILQSYWRLKSETKLPDFEVFRMIENFRAVLGGPTGVASPGIDLATFASRIIRCENPECTPWDLSDETIRLLVGVASDSVKEQYDFLLNKRT